jgi:hypothetical protein
MITKQGDLATVVKMQKQERGLYDQVLEHVRKFLACPETEKQRKIREKLAKLQAKEEQLKKEDLEKQLIQQGDTRFSFQVLIVLDFDNIVSKVKLIQVSIIVILKLQ